MNPDQQLSANIVLLGLVVWRESRGEPYEAKLAVAFSVLTRVKHPSWWGNSIQSVIAKPLQYSSMTHAGDPNLVKYPVEGDTDWNDSIQASTAAISGSVPNPAPTADSYIDNSIAPPPWALKAALVAEIGHFRFYRTV